MECTFEIEVAEPKKGEMMFKPYVNFRIKQLNLAPQCLSDREIDEQIDQLMREVKKLGKSAKKKLKDANARHDKLLDDLKER